MIILFLVFWGTSLLISTVTTLIYISTNNVNAPYPLASSSSFVIFVFLTIAIIIGVRWNHSIVFFTFLLWLNLLDTLYWFLYFPLWQYSWAEKCSCIFLSQKTQNYHFKFLTKGTISVFREKIVWNLHKLKEALGLSYSLHSNRLLIYLLSDIII
jgi:hypothetical protein